MGPNERNSGNCKCELTMFHGFDTAPILASSPAFIVRPIFSFIQMFPEHLDERKDRPHDKSRRAREDRRSIESMKHCQFAFAVSGVAFVRARRRSRANEIRSAGVAAKF